MDGKTTKARSEMRRRKRARRKRKQAIAVFALLLIVLLCVAAVFQLRKKASSTVNTSGQTEKSDDAQVGLSPAADQITDTPSETGETADTSMPAMITLDQNQVYTGDQILVNANHAYNFDANAQTMGLVNIENTKQADYAVKHSDLELSAHIMASLDQMLSDCNAALGVTDNGVTSAYRSLEYQQSIYDETVTSNGEEYARQYVATPGYSEHHTGLAFDLGIYYADGGEGSFSESQNAVWIAENAYRYGFVRRYQESKTAITGIAHEAWHFRYVGIPHATYMTQNDLCLEEYIEYLQTQTSPEAPLSLATEDGSSYQIYYTAQTQISQPAGDYTVSGDNVSGYIITVKM